MKRKRSRLLLGLCYRFLCDRQANREQRPSTGSSKGCQRKETAAGGELLLQPTQSYKHPSVPFASYPPRPPSPYRVPHFHPLSPQECPQIPTSLWHKSMETFASLRVHHPLLDRQRPRCLRWRLTSLFTNSSTSFGSPTTRQSIQRISVLSTLLAMTRFAAKRKKMGGFSSPKTSWHASAS